MIKVIEENISRLLQDKSFLQVSSMQLNGALWWQRKVKELSGQSLEVEKLRAEVHGLEKKILQYEERLEALERLLTLEHKLS